MFNSAACQPFDTDLQPRVANGGRHDPFRSRSAPQKVRSRTRHPTRSIRFPARRSYRPGVRQLQASSITTEPDDAPETITSTVGEGTAAEDRPCPG
jgi:hypothetical protein